MTYPVGSPPSGAYVVGTVGDSQGQSEESVRALIRSKSLNGFGQSQSGFWGEGGFLGMILGALTGGLAFNLGEASTYSAEQYATMNDHTAQITQLVAAFDQLTLQGNAIAFVSNNTWYPSPNLVSFDVVIIAAGAGGGAGASGAYNQNGGAGGGGGGEIHTNIAASFLPKTNGVFDGVPIIVGAGGPGGSASGQVGGGGGNSALSNYLTATGGSGGGGAKTGSNVAPGGAGGAGMIDGGTGGNGARATLDGNFGNGAYLQPQRGGDSKSPYDLHGGGGGGGGGQGDNIAGTTGFGTGGTGGASAGGTSPGQNGSIPSGVVTTGGGGGAGGARTGNNNPLPGGNGAFPGGGGGGGAVKGGNAGGGTFSAGGNGANGKIYIIERFI